MGYVLFWGVIFVAFYFLVIRPLNKRAEKMKRYYTHEQLREMEQHPAEPTGYDKFGLSMYPYSLRNDD